METSPDVPLGDGSGNGAFSMGHSIGPSFKELPPLPALQTLELTVASRIAAGVLSVGPTYDYSAAQIVRLARELIAEVQK